MSNKVKILAVIPARSGSKGIPNKNLKKIQGKTLIRHAIEIAIKSKMFDNIVLSSDSIKYKNEIKNYNNIDFILRGKKISNDKSNSLSAWRDALKKTETKNKIKFDFTYLLEPTNPTRKVKDIKLIQKQINKYRLNSCLTISETPSSFTKHKTLIIKNNKIRYLKSNGYNFTIRQKIPKHYYRNGICYAADTKHIMNCKNNFICNKTGYIIIDRLNINIDTFSDLAIARLIMKND